MKTEEKLLLEVENTLKFYLQRIPFLEIVSIERESAAIDRGIDIVATIGVANRRIRLALEVKGNGQPRYVRMAVAKLARLRQSEPDMYCVFAAPYISPQAAEICIQENVGYMDLAGNFRLTFDHVYIEQEANTNPFPEKRELRSLYARKAERVLRVLLNDPRKQWRIQALAQEADVSLGQAAKVKKSLEDREWLVNSPDGLSLSDPGSLLAEWSRNYKFKKNAVRQYYSLLDIPEIEARLASACEEAGIKYALTGFSAAARYAPFVRYQRAAAYVSRDIELIAKNLSLKGVDSGANVVLVTPYDEGVLNGTKVIDGIRIASPVQVYLDLQEMKGRGEEASNTIFDEVIKQTW